MANSKSLILLLRPLLLTLSAFLLALGIERLGFPSVPSTLYAGNAPYSVVYSELKGSESILWLADPTEPTARRKGIVTVSHQFGYGVPASVSPDGSALAYGLLPAGRRDAFSEGHLWLTAIDGTGQKLVSGKMDLHFPPAWSPSGKQLLFRVVESLPAPRPLPQKMPDPKKAEQTLYDVRTRSSLMIANLDQDAVPRPVIDTEQSDLYPIGWSQDSKGIYFFSLSQDGAQAGYVDVETSDITTLGKLADEPIWNVRLSPDYRRLLFVTAQAGEAGIRGSIWTFDLESRQPSIMYGPQDGPAGATWHPSGMAATLNGSVESELSPQVILNIRSADAIGEPLREESNGIASIPISWSPDAVFLVVRRQSVSPAGRVNGLAVLDSRTGQMREFKGGYADFVGWASKAK